VPVNFVNNVRANVTVNEKELHASVASVSPTRTEASAMGESNEDRTTEAGEAITKVLPNPILTNATSGRMLSEEEKEKKTLATIRASLPDEYLDELKAKYGKIPEWMTIPPNVNGRGTEKPRKRDRNRPTTTEYMPPEIYNWSAEQAATTASGPPALTADGYMTSSMALMTVGVAVALGMLFS
jgi:hypothetical protein